jgi:hypothetical protein
MASSRKAAGKFKLSDQLQALPRVPLSMVVEKTANAEKRIPGGHFDPQVEVKDWQHGRIHGP